MRPELLNWQLKSHSGYDWFEVFYNKILLATIFPEAAGWVWRIEPTCGLPFREGSYYEDSSRARNVCETYILNHMR